MAFNLSAADKILKVRYLPPIRKVLNEKKVLSARIKRHTENVSGKTWTIPLHTGRNKSAGIGRPDGGTLPTHGQQSFNEAVVPNAYTYARIKVTGPTFAATKDQAGSFVRAWDNEVQGAMMDFQKAINRQFHGDGRDALAFWTTADDTSGTDVDDGQGNAFTFLQPGAQTLDLIDGGDNATKRGDSIVVTLGAKGTGVYAITWTGTVTASADTDYLVHEDSLGYQLMGIRGIVDDGNPPLLSGGLHGIDATSSANSFWRAHVFGNGGSNRDLSLELMQEPLDEIMSNSPFEESDVEFMLSNYGVRRKYAQLLVAERRYVNTLELDGGFKGLDYSGIPLIADSDCRRNVIYYIVPETLRIFQTSDFEWLDRQGNALMPVSGEDAYEAVLFRYANLGCVTRNGNALLEDITE